MAEGKQYSFYAPIKVIKQLDALARAKSKTEGKWSRSRLILQAIEKCYGIKIPDDEEMSQDEGYDPLKRDQEQVG